MSYSDITTSTYARVPWGDLEVQALVEEPPVSLNEEDRGLGVAWVRISADKRGRWGELVSTETS